MEKKNVKVGNISAEEKAIEKFTELMIARIEEINGNWKKPWISEGAAMYPKNLSGREYNGMNALLLQMEAGFKGYELPVWATFDRIKFLNMEKDKHGTYKPKTDKDGNKLPVVSINKGAKSFPVFITVFSVINKISKEKISYDDYKAMTSEQQKDYKCFPSFNVYNVFNVCQTNLKESRPKLYEKLMAECHPVTPQEREMFCFTPIDTMIKDNLWLCPIKEIYGDDAYYTISKDEIVVPEKKQFTDGESFYSNLLHEMAHSTGADKRLGRLSKTNFGSNSYAREELVAELTAAVVSSKYGMVKHVKDDSAAYLKCWLDNMKESPDYLKKVLIDVKRATSMIVQRISEIENNAVKAA